MIACLALRPDQHVAALVFLSPMRAALDGPHSSSRRRRPGLCARSPAGRHDQDAWRAILPSAPLRPLLCLGPSCRFPGFSTAADRPRAPHYAKHRRRARARCSASIWRRNVRRESRPIDLGKPGMRRRRQREEAGKQGDGETAREMLYGDSLQCSRFGLRAVSACDGEGMMSRHQRPRPRQTYAAGTTCCSPESFRDDENPIMSAPSRAPACRRAVRCRRRSRVVSVRKVPSAARMRSTPSRPRQRLPERAHGGPYEHALAHVGVVPEARPGAGERVELGDDQVAGEARCRVSESTWHRPGQQQAAVVAQCPEAGDMLRAHREARLERR